ncbi:MAG: outer membrane lipoprotein-sorting protein [Candidatus Moranbacteria bacterium]|jgi:hypothetical protein|nr:outer membrane lipoprotein-sorting protein [Candidatus Moranbacteria bacterium]MDX9855971.1 outer membrane lipoprotein-sorting protein [Candidatus Moranbacteria bacterium]
MESELKFKLGIIVLQIIFLVFIFFFAIPSDGAEITAKETMAKAWSDAYPASLQTEFIFGKEAEGEKRDFGAWTDLHSGKAEVFIGSYNDAKGVFSGRTGGTLFVPADDHFGYKVYVSRETGRRANVKEKAGSFDAPANGTQLNYFDVVRSLLPEDPEKFEFLFVLGEGADYLVRAEPKNPVEGDYAFRIFSLKKMSDGKLVITKIFHYLEGNKLSKTIENSQWDLADGIWRSRELLIKTDNESTRIVIEKREFNQKFGDLSEKDLKEGRPAR